MASGRSADGKQPPVNNIDRLIHEPSRYLIMAHLYVLDSADFLFLVRQTGMTWGNLSAHISKLEEARYVNVPRGYYRHTMPQKMPAWIASM